MLLMLLLAQVLPVRLRNRPLPALAAAVFYWHGRSRAKKYCLIFLPTHPAEALTAVILNRISFRLPFIFPALTRISISASAQWQCPATSRAFSMCISALAD